MVLLNLTTLKEHGHGVSVLECIKYSLDSIFKRLELSVWSLSGILTFVTTMFIRLLATTATGSQGTRSILPEHKNHESIFVYANMNVRVGFNIFAWFF